MPKIAEVEYTPNPNARKFVLKEPLTWGIARSYENAGAAEGDPLAAALFDIEHVTNVYYVDHWITVTQDGGAQWDELLRQLAVPIREAAAADAQSEHTVAAAAVARADMDAPTLARLERINALLDDQIRPYLQNDGGNLEVIDLTDTELVVHYQGACGSCPSSTAGTLSAIENIVHTIEPDLEVVAV
ncbi:MAG: NifU family protein [Proteobacteria bacterium]|nr:NifU family protein [Burkholderiales bacterium]